MNNWTTIENLWDDKSSKYPKPLGKMILNDKKDNLKVTFGLETG